MKKIKKLNIFRKRALQKLMIFYVVAFSCFTYSQLLHAPPPAPAWILQHATMARLIWTNDGSKRVILRSEVPFGGLNNVPLPPPQKKLKFLAHK